MYRSTAWLAVLIAPCLSAQFTGLASTSDGSSVYFASTLRLKGAAQPINGKIFVATQEGVKLFRAREREGTGAASACATGGFVDYTGAETSSTGAIALSYRAASSGGCSFPVNTATTQILTAAGETLLPGVVRFSSGGRFAIRFLGLTARPFDPVNISFLDFQTNVHNPIEIPVFSSPQLVRIPSLGGRVIANDGTALIGLVDRFLGTSGYILRPGADPQPFPIPDVFPLLIDASASKVVFQRPDQSLSLLNLRTLESNFLLRGDQFFSNLNLSDDGRRLLFLRDGQVHVLDTNTLVDRILTNEAAKITEATLSGDGKVVYAVTGRGGLLKISADDSTTLELIGHTPYLRPSFGPIVAGLSFALEGAGLSDTVIDGTPPLPSHLGEVTIRIGERKVPIVRLEPTSVRILIPWDTAGAFRIVAEIPGRNTPFDFPEVERVVSQSLFAFALRRQDWTQTYSGPVKVGEIIHVYAAGLGPVSPEVPDGAAAPSAEPFSRITQSLTCYNAEILYAGLAPGTVERIYQIDVRIGPATGYQQFKCSFGGSPLFIFLSLNVLPSAQN